MIGHVSEFNPAKEEFNSYVERLDQFFIVNDVEETKKVPLFITLIGPETYSVLKHLLDPVTPQDSRDILQICDTSAKNGRGSTSFLCAGEECWRESMKLPPCRDKVSNGKVSIRGDGSGDSRDRRTTRGRGCAGIELGWLARAELSKYICAILCATCAQ
ncbi:uncharacterized protein LOC124171478 [Ischnura elegans]|uniref:uncharacterized protein LOC124171478 n=1 Tax=Ischnura elegans TaxID=197161 RepID=UPI001ED88B36|nr:uncharacterized protein LOC124171478 [Ischnura elegans]